MVYETLFAMDSDANVHARMAEGYAVSDDKKTYTITLRDGLMWHDGKPVTAEDCIASIKRRAKKDGIGQKLNRRVPSGSSTYSSKYICRILPG